MRLGVDEVNLGPAPRRVRQRCRVLAGALLLPVIGGNALGLIAPLGGMVLSPQQLASGMCRTGEIAAGMGGASGGQISFGCQFNPAAGLTD